MAEISTNFVDTIKSQSGVNYKINAQTLTDMDTTIEELNALHGVALKDGQSDIASKTYVEGQITNINGVIDGLDSTYATLANPALSGVPTAPTATDGTNTEQIATTAFVTNAINGVLASEVTFRGATATLPTSPVNGDMWKVTADIAKTDNMDSAARIGDVIIYSTNSSMWSVVPSGDDLIAYLGAQEPASKYAIWMKDLGTV